MAIETTGELRGLTRKVDQVGEYIEFRLRLRDVELWYQFMVLLEQSVAVTIAGNPDCVSEGERE